MSDYKLMDDHGYPVLGKKGERPMYIEYGEARMISDTNKNEIFESVFNDDEKIPYFSETESICQRIWEEGGLVIYE